jgi:DNA-binding transcriptional LysR family regulator
LDRFEAMSILLHAVEGGSLSEAGRRLGVPLATVSRKISDLEAHLNTTLLMRSSKGLVPTPAGRSFLIAAKSILEQLHEAERAAAGEYTAPTGDLVVTAPVVFGRQHVLPVVMDFMAAYPEVDVGLMLSDRLAHLLDDQVDVAVRIGDLPDSALNANRVGFVRRVVCASPTYLSKHGLPTAPHELADHMAISREGVSSPVVWRFQASGAQVEVTLRSRLSVNTAEAAIDAAVSGIGLTRPLSYQIVDQVREGSLAIALEAFEPPPRPVHLLYNGQSRVPLKLRAFVDFVAPRLRNRLEDAAL